MAGGLTSMTVENDAEALGHFDDPPIVEVVCGVKFGPVAGLDPIMLGAYWKERAEEYPTREVHEALVDSGPLVLLEAPHVRFWFVSPGGEFLLQLQHDRFFVNWRKVRDGSYPRFNDRDGQSGVLTRALGEFEIFSTFCERNLGVRPAPVRCELSKIDHLLEGRHWRDARDLAELLPWLQSFVGFSTSAAPEVSVQFAEPREGGNLVVTLRSAVTTARKSRAVVVETRIARQLTPGADLADVFRAANAEVNRVFGHLIPPTQRYRFARKETTT